MVKPFTTRRADPAMPDDRLSFLHPTSALTTGFVAPSLVVSRRLLNGFVTPQDQVHHAQ